MAPLVPEPFISAEGPVLEALTGDGASQNDTALASDGDLATAAFARVSNSSGQSGRVVLRWTFAGADPIPIQTNQEYELGVRYRLHTITNGGTSLIKALAEFSIDDGASYLPIETDLDQPSGTDTGEVHFSKTFNSTNLFPGGVLNDIRVRIEAEVVTAGGGGAEVIAYAHEIWIVALGTGGGVGSFF